MAYLKRAKLVAGQREGKWIHYKITEPKNEEAKEIFAKIMKILEADKEMRLDRKNLATVCCAPSPAPVKITASVRQKT